MKVVIDINILFSALLQGGQKYQDVLFFERKRHIVRCVDIRIGWSLMDG